MAKLQLLAGTTSKMINIFVQDSSVATGAGLTGLAFNTSSLTAYYHREGASSAVQISLVTATLGTFTSSGFIVVDGTNMPGVYELGLPNAAIAAGAKWVVIMLKGATNMAPVVLEIELTATDNQAATNGGLTNLDAAITSRLAPTVAARTLDVSAGGEAGVDWANVGSPTTTLSLTGTTVATVTTTGTATAVTTVNGLAANVITATSINADAITAAKIADGAIDAATFAAGAINAAAIAADAITDAKVASDVTIASVTGAVGSVTGNVGGNVVGSVASVTAGVTVTTNNDKTGYGLSAAAVQAIWDALTSALTTVGSIGKRISDNLDAAITSRMATFTYTTPPTVVAIRTEMDSNSTKLANLDATVSSRATPAQVNTEADTALADVGLTTTITGRIDVATSTRLATAGYTAPPTAAANADAVWDETLSGHLATGSTGEALNGAGAAGDPWTTTLPGAYGAGSAGKIIGDNINATVSSRATQVSVDDIPTNAELATSQAAADDATLAAIAGISVPTVADILAGVIEGSITLKGALRLAISVLTGKASGGGTTTIVFRDTGDTKDRITATVDSNGNRTTVTRDITD
jgi:hypothetical protein